MHLKRILAAVDLASPAPQGVLAAAELAALSGAELILLTVLRDPWTYVHADEVEGYRRTHQGSPAALAAARASQELARFAAPAVLAAPAVSYRTAFGLPGIEIARQAERDEADLIVLGRDNETRREVTESITAATLRRGRVPVLIAPSTHRVYRHILACVDDSPSAPSVLAAALAMGDYCGAPVLALHVDPTDAPITYGERPRWLRRLEQKNEHSDVTVATCETVVRQGDAATEIVAEVVSRSIDLVVLGFCRGKSIATAGAPVGVTARVLRRVDAAVLTVPI